VINGKTFIPIIVEHKSPKQNHKKVNKTIAKNKTQEPLPYIIKINKEDYTPVKGKQPILIDG
jgi:hypothetical protein